MTECYYTTLAKTNVIRRCNSIAFDVIGVVKCFLSI